MPDYLPRWKSIGGSVKKRGMSVTAVSLGVPFFYNQSLNLNSPSEQVRNASVAFARNGIDFASRIGAEIIYACSMKREPPKECSNSLGWLKESVSECARYAEARGVKFALEPFPTGELPTVKETMDFIRSAQVENLGVLIDSGHAAIAGESLTAASRLSKGRITHVHLNNNDGVSDLHWPPQKGKLSEEEFADFLSALKAQRYSGRVSLEISKPQPPAETLVRSRLFVENILKTS